MNSKFFFFCHKLPVYIWNIIQVTKYQDIYYFMSLNESKSDFYLARLLFLLLIAIIRKYQWKREIKKLERWRSRLDNIYLYILIHTDTTTIKYRYYFCYFKCLFILNFDFLKVYLKIFNFNKPDKPWTLFILQFFIIHLFNIQLLSSRCCYY